MSNPNEVSIKTVINIMTIGGAIAVGLVFMVLALLNIFV